MVLMIQCKCNSIRSILGVPGAYSEAAAKKAYPSCETVPCEYFETAFQVPSIFF